jgi:cation diffusion facilitator CzcD-associated flavoprotein CzcO
MDSVQVVVIGAGAAGLATAACLQRRGIKPLVLDRGTTVGQTWADRYDRLHLHTPRIQSHLPGYRMPARAGRWIARDDMVRYLQAYAAHHRIDVRFGVTVDSVRPVAGGYRVTGDGIDVTVPYVVVATGLNSVPVMPSWPGVESFTGTLIHAVDYRNAADLQGRDVLVVGVGNSGAEIAADLAESGARRVWVSVRTPPHVIPRQLGPVPTTLLGIVQSFLPPVLTDPINRQLSRIGVGDLSPFGLPAPDEGLSARMRRRGSVPTIDVGMVAQLRTGKVEVVAALSGFQGPDAQLSDGRLIRPDAVIAATGYRDGITELLDAPYVEGRAPGLYTVGLTQSQKGLLFQINLDARRVTRAIIREERGHGQHRAAPRPAE